MQDDSQTSPSTLAYDVKMSAKTTSEKCTRWFMGDDMHLLMLLEVPGKRAPRKNFFFKNVRLRTKTHRMNASRSGLCMKSNGEIMHIRTTSAHTDGINLNESTRTASPYVTERYITHAAVHHTPYQRARR